MADNRPVYYTERDAADVVAHWSVVLGYPADEMRVAYVPGNEDFYRLLFDNRTDAVEFENQALSIPRAWLPACAQAVLDGADPTPEYWDWLSQEAIESSPEDCPEEPPGEQWFRKDTPLGYLCLCSRCKDNHDEDADWEVQPHNGYCYCNDCGAVL
jgi:hypothetical protein